MNKAKGTPEAPVNPPADPPAPVEFELSLEDTLSQHRRVSPPGAKGAVGGYNPYDTPIGSTDDRNPRKTDVAPEPKRKPTDLRKLSEWIRLQRQVEALKKDPKPDPESESE